MSGIDRASSIRVDARNVRVTAALVDYPPVGTALIVATSAAAGRCYVPMVQISKTRRIVAKQSRFTPRLESTSYGNRPVRRANFNVSYPSNEVERLNVGGRKTPPSTVQFDRSAVTSAIIASVPRTRPRLAAPARTCSRAPCLT